MSRDLCVYVFTVYALCLCVYFLCVYMCAIFCIYIYIYLHIYKLCMCTLCVCYVCTLHVFLCVGMCTDIICVSVYALCVRCARVWVCALLVWASLRNEAPSRTSRESSFVPSQACSSSEESSRNGPGALVFKWATELSASVPVYPHKHLSNVCTHINTHTHTHY